MQRPVTFYSERCKLVVLRGYGHYEVYAEPAFSEVMAHTLDWYQTYLSAR